jgi:AraC-like DNA-binding protein
LLQQVVQDRGADPIALLTDTRVTKEMLDAPDGLIPAYAYALMILRAVQLTGDACLGCEMGLRMAPTMHGNLGLLCLTSATGVEALHTVSRFLRLVSPFLEASLTFKSTRVLISLQEIAPMGAVRSFIHQCVMVGLARGGRMLVGPPSDKSDFILHFSGPEPACFAKYRDRLPLTQFNQPRDGADVSMSYASLPIALSDQLTAKKASMACEREFARFNQGSVSFAALVASLLKANSDANGYPSMDKMARRLSISTRTLTRRLDAEGLNFSQLVDERRCVDAQLMLSQTDFSVGEVAARLGYADPANFTRAFRKWTGKTPSIYRRETHVG